MAPHISTSADTDVNLNLSATVGLVMQAKRLGEQQLLL